MTDFKCPFCGKPYSSAGALWYHKKKKHPDQRSTAIRRTVNRPSSPRQETPSAAEEPTVGESEIPFYPSLKDWESRQSKDREEKAERGPIGPVGPQLQPAALNLSSFWHMAGEFVDSKMKDEKFKVHMTESKARDLDEGLKQMGLMTLPAPTIIIPNWAPFLITVGVTFGLPLVALARDFVAKMMEDLKKSREAKKTPPPPIVSEEHVGSVYTPPVIPDNVQTWHDPTMEEG